MQDTRGYSLVWEDSTGHVTKPCPTVSEPKHLTSWILQATLPVLHKRSPHTTTRQPRPVAARESLCAATKTQNSQKQISEWINNFLKFSADKKEI